jgi:Initiator Replication protein
MGKTKSSNSSQKVQSEKVSLKFFRLAFKNPTSCSAKRSTMSSTSPSQNIGPVGLNPFLIGDEKLLKPALQLMNVFRLKIDEIKEDEVFTSYTRWLESVQVRGTENQEVYVTFSQRFERIWLELKKRLPQHVVKEPANIGLRSQYSIRLYAWAKKYASVGTKHISLEDLRKLLGLESVKSAEGIVIQEAPLPVWANFRQSAK